MYNSIKLIEQLKEEKYNIKVHEHQPLFTVEDSKILRGKINGAHSKNLFLKNKKNKFFLFSCVEDTSVNLKQISKSLKLGNVSFAKKDDLYKYLGVYPGSVTPFGLLNDKECKVEFYFDQNFKSFSRVNFHPLVNTSTISLLLDDFLNFLIANDKKVNIYNFINHSLDI